MGEINKTNSYTEFFYKAFRNILLVSIPLVIISALILSLPHSSAEDNASGDVTKVDSITLTLNVSCTLSATELTPHNIALEGNGLHRENIGTTKVGVFCNDNNGYNIYAVGHSNNTDGNTDLIVDGLSSDYNIKTGIYSSGSTISSWGMKLTAGTGTGSESERTPPTINNGYNNYNVVPNIYTLVASRPSGTNMDKDANPDITGSYFTTTYDIYASSVQPAGTYNGKVKYILTHPNTNAPNTINDIDAAFAINGKQKAYQDSKGSYYAMQDMTTDICNSVARTGEATTTQLVDIRDNKLYYVTKLKDGHCWMTQNLDLDIGGTGVAALTSENTDISPTASGSGIYNTTGGYTVDSNNVWTWNPAGSAITANHTINGTSVSNWTNSGTAPYSVEGGDVYYYTSNGSGNDSTFNSLDKCATNTNGRTEANCIHYHRGNYYNWTAAIASNNSSGFNTQYDNASNSICPKNWRLPVATNSDQSTYEFGDLLYTYYSITQAKYNTSNITNSVNYTSDGFVNIRKSPLWFVRSGYIYSSTLGSAAANGYYWSSTVVSSDNAYLLFFLSSGVWPSSSDRRSGGWSVRCIAR